jgi:hypothetical protein
MTRPFVEACASEDMRGLLSLLSEDVVLYSDGGGKAVTAARRRTPVMTVEKLQSFVLDLPLPPRRDFDRSVRTAAREVTKDKEQRRCYEG